MERANLVKWIERMLKPGERVIGVVIGEYGWGGGWGKPGYGEDKCPKQIPWSKRGVVLSWSEARKWLDYDFDNDYGSPNCHAVYVWTNRRIFFVSQYDGYVTLMWIPRHPRDCRPKMAGGG